MSRLESVHRLRWWRLGGLLAGFLLLITCAWFAWQFQARRSSVDAIRMAQRSGFHNAEPMLRVAFKRDSSNVELSRTLAVGLVEANRLEEAETVVTAWCKAHPNQAEPYRRRMELRYARAMQARPGDVRMQLNESALADGLRVIELDPGDVATIRNVGWLLLAMGRFEEADRLCRRNVERHPDDIELLYLQARVCHGLGANEEALRFVDKVLSRNPQFTPCHMLRAILYYEAGRADEAIPLFRAAAAGRDGSHHEAKYYLGLSLARAGHTDEAKKVMAEVQCSIFERDCVAVDCLAVRIRRAELLFDCGRDDEALAALQVVLAAQPEHAAAHRLLAAHYRRRGDQDKAAFHEQRSQKGEKQGP